MSAQINQDIKANSRIHAPITLHDHIVETFHNKINTNKTTNREDLIKRIRRRFQESHKVDAIATFINGNTMYIIMIDMLDKDAVSPTDPITGRQVVIRSDG